jgi:hypothetical protein
MDEASLQPKSDEGREPEGFLELSDAIAALWAADGGEQGPVHVERPGTPQGRWWPR